MESKEALVIFEGIEIRRMEKDGQQWISALDVAKALGYDNPSVAIQNIVSRNYDKFLDYSCTTKLVVRDKNGVNKSRELMFLNLKGVIAFCMFSKQKQAIPFQRWADSVLEKEILNIPSDIRLKATRKRVEFTDTLKEHGYTKKHEYIQTTVQMKKELDIDKPKSECDLIEVMKIAVSEDLARLRIAISEKNGYQEVNPLCVESAKTINNVVKQDKTFIK